MNKQPVLKWVISNCTYSKWGNPVFKNKYFSVYVDVCDDTLRQKRALLCGYVLPRLGQNVDSRMLINKDRKEVVALLPKVKGLFQIIKWDNNGFLVAGDHHGVMKWFDYIDGDEFILTNDIKNILDVKEIGISRESILDHSLFNRFINGNTIFQQLQYSGMAPYYEYDVRSNIVSKKKYWNYEKLADLDLCFTKFDEISNRFDNIISDYVEKFKSDKISVPITGGLDCRTILASLLNKNCLIHSYTYGHPESSDSINGQNTADQLNLTFNCHYLNNKEDYRSLEEDIIDYGNSLVSTNRAHRLHGILKESTKSDIMFLGYLGGELVRGLWPDDLIISKPIRLSWENKLDKKYIVEEAYKEAELLYNKDDIAYGVSKLNKFSGEKLIDNYFKYLFEIKAHLHYAQDIWMFMKYIQIVPIYLDIDYLELIFSSPFNLLNKRSMTKNKLHKLDSPLYNCNLIDRLNPEVSKIVMGKGFSPRQYTNNKYYALLLKLFQEISKNRYHPNYKFQEWRVQYMLSNITQFSIFKPSAIENVVKYTSEKTLLPLSRKYDIGLYDNILNRKAKKTHTQ